MSEIWAATDCETTGLNPADGHLLLEIHLEIVEPVYPFRRIAGPFHRVVRQNSQQAFDLADDYVREMHTRTGLWWKIDGGTPAEEVDDNLLSFLQANADYREVFLVGNSLRLDQNFIETFLPRSAAWLHYRAIDVTSLAMWARHNLGIPRFEKGADHTAGGDTRAMLDELRFITEQATELPRLYGGHLMAYLEEYGTTDDYERAGSILTRTNPVTFAAPDRQIRSEGQPHDLSVACLTDEHDRCAGTTNPEYIGGVAKCVCDCHTKRQDGADDGR